MSALLYLETNWILGAVMGQDFRVDDLLIASESHIHLAIPGVCVTEAMSAFKWKRIERNRLKNELDVQVNQLKRSTDIPTAQQLAGELTQADLTNAGLLSELFQRLDLARIAGTAELIPISAEVIYHELRLIKEMELDRNDALILASILSHAKNDAADRKAFLTKNVNDFQKQPVKDLLKIAGLKLFSSTERALDWAVAKTK